MAGKYCCANCGKRFCKPSLLQRHEITHRADKPFECLLCGQKFTQLASLQRHSASKHDGIKQHACKQCGECFAQRANLATHIKSLHNVKSQRTTTFPCDYCACVFSKKFTLNRHKAAKHTNANVQQTTQTDMATVEDAAKLAQNVVAQLKRLQCGMQNSKAVEVVDNKPPALENTTIDAVVANEMVTLKDKLNPQKLCNKIAVQRIRRTNTAACFVCEFCAKEFRTTYQYIRHRRSHTNERPYKCAYCVKSFKTNSKCRAHSKLHILHAQLGVLAKQHACSICSKSYDSMRQFDAHMRCAHSTHTARYMCTYCNASFATRTAFAVHKHDDIDSELEGLKELLPKPIDLRCNITLDAIQPANSQFQCVYCTRTFKTQQNCRKHMLMHIKQLLNGENVNKTEPKLGHEIVTNNDSSDTILKTPLQLLPRASKSQTSSIAKATSTLLEDVENFCEFCAKSFKKCSDLQRHKRTHTHERPFSCLKCGKSFKLKSTLQEHALTHQTTRLTYRCQVCSKQFVARKSLIIHLRLHTQACPFACLVCAQTFRTSGQRITHMKARHEHK